MQNERLTAINTTKIEALLAQGSIVTIAGRQGVANGEITTLGEGGSATLAVHWRTIYKQHMLCVKRKSIIYTASQQAVPTAKCMPEISFDEM